MKTYTCAELFAAWQWYNFEKVLYVEAEKIGSEEKYLRLIRLDMAQAYRSLTTLLNSPHYASAIRWLAGNAATPWETGDEMDSTLRERLLRSLFITTEKDATKVLTEPEELPLPAPGMEKETSWRDITLHPIFKLYNKREVVRFIYSVLLPRYDFRSALKMAVLETSDTPPEDTPTWLIRCTDVYNQVRLAMADPLYLWLGSIVWLILMVLLGHVLTAPSGWMSTSSASLLRINIVQFLFFAVLIIAVRLLFGPNFIIYLSLPRLMSGIIIGYLALLFQNDPSELSGAIWQGSCMAGVIKVTALWAGVITLGWLYLKYDIRPVLQNDRLTNRRSWFTLGVALFISAFLGLLTIAITSQIKPFSDSIYYILGPFGWVDLTQYLTYVPLALITGLVTQFIFEDKTLTAPVWSPEKPD